MTIAGEKTNVAHSLQVIATGLLVLILPESTGESITRRNELLRLAHKRSQNSQVKT